MSELRKILDGFLPSQILGDRPSKNCTQVITPGWRHVIWIKICDDISISSELIDVYTLNFEPNFKFSLLNFFLGDPIPLGCALGSLGQSLACVKISGRSSPLRAKIQSPEKCTLRWVNTHVNNFFVCDQSSKTFFSPTWEGS